MINENKVKSRKIKKTKESKDIFETKQVDIKEKSSVKKIRRNKLRNDFGNSYTTFDTGSDIRKVRSRRLNVKDLNQDEVRLDREIENEDNLSITIMILILVLCFVVGIFLGYMLYRLAMNGGNALMILWYFLR